MDKKVKASERDAFRLIEAMLRLMESRGLMELELEQQGLRIRLKRAVGGVAPTLVDMRPATPAPATSATAEETKERSAIKSPMVGTFYQCPAPDAPSFVEVGQQIEVGQVVCIIEAMKLMNEIKAEIAGRIVEVLVQNGDPVEFGQSLFVIDP